jgi:uncharacterized iron-regulated membrane protein
MAASTFVARPSWVWLHRWGGLALAGVLVVVGLTGSLLAFDHELERVFAPQLFAAPHSGAAPLDLATLAERAEMQVPHGKVIAVTFIEPDQVLVAFDARKDPATGRPYRLGFDEYYVDPWTGKELGHRTRAALSEGLVNVMPFVYELHWRLVAGNLGQWILGIVALLWTIDCFNGFYLTLPKSLSGFWNRWKPAWKIKHNASFFRLNFDLHRAGGLWLWALLLVFAWSSVMMNIRPWYEPVMRTLFDYRSFEEDYRANLHPNDTPRLSWQAAQQRGEQLLTEQSALHGFSFGQRLNMMYDSSSGAYLYEVRGSRDLFERVPQGGGTFVMFDGNSGELRLLSQPTGERTGNTIESWLYALHMARVFGRAYQVLVCILGLVTAVLSITGVYIWLKKRRAAHWRRRDMGPVQGV